MKKPTLVLLHDATPEPRGWQAWHDRALARGLDCVASPAPRAKGMSADHDEARAHDAHVDATIALCRMIDGPVVLVGRGRSGAIVRALLDCAIGDAGIVIAPVPRPTLASRWRAWRDRRRTRAPLLFVVGDADGASLAAVRADFRRESRRPAVTALHVHPARGDCPIADPGADDVFDYVVDWALARLAQR